MQFTIDLHCHPDLRPFGKSFSTPTPGTNPEDRHQLSSVWYFNPPGARDRAVQRLTGICSYSQSNFSALSYGNVRCICAGLYSVEKKFVTFNVLGTGPVTDFFANLVGSIGTERINFIQANNDYFADLENIYKYYLQLNNKVIQFNDVNRKYVLVKNFNDLEQSMQENEGNAEVETIYVIITIEGMHDLNVGNGNPPDENQIMQNLLKMKGWEHKPFFVTFAHHFYNELCGHAESLNGFIQDLLTDQEAGMNTGFTDLGWKVLKALIDDANGGRIHIDIKHMSALSRRQYIGFLKTDHAEEYGQKKFPLIMSHGACNGKQSATNPNATPELELTASRMFDGDINFFDEEIVEMAKSGGIIGLQLDERRIASTRYKESLRLTLASATKRMHSNSKMLWNNIQHIAQLLDKNDLFAWDCMAIGSDFDGVIDPINMFWSQEDMDDLVQFTERHAFNFMSDPETVFKNSFNNIEASEIIERLFHFNAYEFFRKYFK